MENEKVKEAPVISGNLAYVIVSKPRKNQNSPIDTAFLDFQWLLKARSKGITRPNITGILVEPAKIIATDGNRLHIIANPYPGIPPGEYEVYGINQSKIILISKTLAGSAFTNTQPFPDWNKPTITMEGVKPEHEFTVDHPVYFYTEILKHLPFRIEYLQDAISDEPMNVKIYSEEQPVIITTATRTAIVAPLKDRKVS